MEEILRKVKSTPEYLRCLDFDQNNPHHHLLLGKHMEETEKNLAKLGYERMEKLMLAAALHDIGKPEAARFDPKAGCTRFFGHAEASAKIANRLLIAGGLPAEDAAIVCWYIRHHDDFISFRLGEIADHPFIREITAGNIAEVMVKSVIDVSGRPQDINATVRYIVTGKKPSWGSRLPWKINTDMPHTCIETAFANLMALCRADAMAQNPYSERPTMGEKLEVNTRIRELIHEAAGIATTSIQTNAAN